MTNILNNQSSTYDNIFSPSTHRTYPTYNTTTKKNKNTITKKTHCLGINRTILVLCKTKIIIPIIIIIILQKNQKNENEMALTMPY
eukprot:UN27383